MSLKDTRMATIHRTTYRFFLRTVGILKTIAAQRTEIKEIAMARIIEFYIPKNFRKTLKCAPQLQSGKVIEFCLQAKKSA